MREITGHRVGDVNDKLTIMVTDQPGAGGANHRYCITGFEISKNPSRAPLDSVDAVDVIFQNGPIKEAGVNGITQEALIAICIDRLQSFQGGRYACHENAVALTHLETALMWLQKRTLERVARGVEGTHQK